MLISFEGIDGSGKSTQVRLLVDRLSQTGYRTVLVREPGGTPLSERIRELLLDPSLHVVPFAELLLFSAARRQLVEERIRPALEEGLVVVCDRFFDSTTAYQGAGRGIAAPDWVRGFSERVTGGLVPRRTYVVAVEPEEAQARRSERSDDRMEAADEGFHRRVADAYDQLAIDEPERVVRLDGSQPVDLIHDRVWDDVQQLLEAEHRLSPAG